jgi:hypothetical protein
MMLNTLNHKKSKMKKLLLLLAIPASMAFTTSGTYDGRPLSAMLTGSQEVPNLGDPDGSGYVTLELNQGQGTISYELTVENIDPATAAHIHIGPIGVAGRVLLHLEAPTDGYSSGVLQVDPELIKAIRKNPGGFYVNVHNARYQGGAVRGQLSK